MEHVSSAFRILIGTCALLWSSGISVVANAGINYEYDAAGRLRKVTYDDGMIVDYTLDAAGNRTSHSVVVVSQLAITHPSATEGSPLNFLVTKEGNLTASTSVSYQSRTSTGTAYATAPADYSAVSGTLTFAPGETQKSFSISTVDDAITEPSEWIIVDLSNPTGGAQLNGSIGTGTILDNDQTPTCTFAAYNAEGNDEFSVYPFIQRTGSCSTAVTVSVAVEYVSGTGTYQLGPLNGGTTINASDQYKSQTIWPWYGSVPPGSPLRLKVTWSITSGNGVISPNVGYVMIYNSDCYC